MTSACPSVLSERSRWPIMEGYGGRYRIVSVPPPRGEHAVVEMTVEAIFVDQGERFIVVLRDDSQTKVLPIIVGQFEAKAIDVELRRRKHVRPQTHDLLRNALTEIGAQVRRIVVTDLRDETYYAIIDVVRNGIAHQIDARPSDAIALALRCRAPIFVDQKVVDAAALPRDASGSPQHPEQVGPDVDRKFRDILSDAGLDDVG